jgi:hypothetical protein
MNTQIRPMGLALALMMAAIPLAEAQQNNSNMSNMPGMSKTSPKAKTHDMPGMDMQSMMKQCADMRKHMKPGATMTGDMQKMMSQCDEMDKSMTAPEQPYTPPAERRR